MTPEVIGLVNKVFSFSLFKSFINNKNELIILPNLNVYFRLEDVETELDFKCKILEWVSKYVSQNHWDRYWSPKILKFINYMLNTDFNKDEINTIYCKLGNRIHHNLTIKFVQSNYDFKLIK